MTRIREDHKDNDWEKVITEVNEFKSRYPYSPFVAESDLLQADAYFQSAKYTEAVVSYTEFLKKNPNHPQASLASFRM